MKNIVKFLLFGALSYALIMLAVLSFYGITPLVEWISRAGLVVLVTCCVLLAKAHATR